MGMAQTGKLDERFSEATEPVSWQQVSDVLAAAELYWLTTVRRDGRPHITPLVGAWVDDAFVFCTGPEEQKAQNLNHSTAVAVTTGVNTWNDGLDVIVEGNAERLTGRDRLTKLAARHTREVRRRLGFHCRRRRVRPHRRCGRQPHRLRLPRAARQGAGVREVTARSDDVPLLAFPRRADAKVPNLARFTALLRLLAVRSSAGNRSSPGRASPGTRRGPRRPHRSCTPIALPHRRTAVGRRARHRSG